MKRSGPIQRKTPMQRGGKRLKAVSAKNSRPVEDKGYRFRYWQARPFCELSWWFAANMPKAIPGVRHTETSTEVHHIHGSRKGRHDVELNLLATCRAVHIWCHAHPREGKILSVWLKVKQGLFKPKVFKEISGMFLEGWVELHKPEMTEVLPLWEELLTFSQDTRK